MDKEEPFLGLWYFLTLSLHCWLETQYYKSLHQGVSIQSLSDASFFIMLFHKAMETH